MNLNKMNLQISEELRSLKQEDNLSVRAFFLSSLPPKVSLDEYELGCLHREFVSGSLNKSQLQKIINENKSQLQKNLDKKIG